MAGKTRIDDEYLTTPLYSFAEAARILTVPPSTLRNWAVGYTVKRADGRPATIARPLITTSPARGRASVPFVGLAEAYTLRAFKAAGVPVQRIRPAIAWLEKHFGLAQALASERLMTDGAEVLFDFAAHTNDEDARQAVDGLVVVRSGQQVFRPVVRDYLSRVTYRNGWISLIRLPQYGPAEVIIDPRRNGGRPTIERRGIRVDTVLGRIASGEPAADVAADYLLTGAELAALRAAA